MERAPSVGKVFFPLDEELELLPGNLAPRQQEHLVHLACFMPFDKVAEMMKELLSVRTKEETVRRLTEQAGGWIEASQTAEVEATGESESKQERPLERCVFSADGAMISLIHKQWAETRTVAIGEPQERVNAEGEREIHVGKLSYFSRLADASTFTRLAEVEVRRRRVREAKEVAAVMDGADWCQTFADKHRPDAVRILDFPHAAEHITQLLEVLGTTKLHFPPQTLERCLHILKHRGPQPLLRMADRMGSHLAGRKGVQEHLEYLRKREAFMQYREFRSSGWPIGSGMVESANKNIVEARLKGTGMHWQRKNVNPMLALRNAICNGRWREMWQKAVLHHQKLQALQRSAQAEQRAQARKACGNTPSAKSPPQSAPSSRAESPPVASPPPASIVTRPSSSHPSSRRKQRTTPKQVKYSPQGSGEVSVEACICGNPLERVSGRDRTRRYCSERCSNRSRKRAQREREKQWRSSSAQPSQVARSAEAPPVIHQLPVPARVKQSPQRSSEVSGEVCVCGTPLLQPIGGQTRRYCSHRCRQRAYRQRQAKIP